ncbi:murein biosynthesis integral membrane protein MurJ [Nonomuraea endophytica]|uniref:Putative peptidoglycan lipid II flippase n=1 Tax=Nonomuraea endophytica TaxID=714136 RepID=A0A7W8ADK1_9ACTN|nr:lipid II flippase MurJ [Nonomuraea endophytica]MBB5084269.1 putative peptidoglycan lipid II flippase [Nonomuraea endophytica]
MTGRLARGVAGGAVLIGAITILARITGFAKQYVFAQTVGTGCLSTAYFTANQIPNIVFEVVVGGALAGMVVPVLAGAAARARPWGEPPLEEPDSPEAARGAQAVAPSPVEAHAYVSRVSSALLTWVLVVLVPLAVAVALLAGPIAGLFYGSALPPCEVEAVRAVTADMLVVFAPQIPLYGVAVVLYGVLQAHKRFAGPAVAPLVSSIVVIAAYLVFVPVSGGTSTPVSPLDPGETVLAVGTSLGVLALVLTVAGPALRLGLRWRPTLRFPDGVAAQVRGLAFAGIAGLLAQQAAMVVVLYLSNGIGVGAIAVYNYAWAIYLVPYAVLAVPIATSAFPGLSARAESGDEAGFAGLAARTTRAVVLVSGLAAGALAAMSGPGAEVFLLGSESAVPHAQFARTIALFAPGLIGYGLIAHLSRVLYAAGKGREAAAGTVAGWLVVMAAQAGFVLVLPDGWEIAGMALGMSVGMTVGGIWLLVAVLRARGGAAAAGLVRAAFAAVAGGAAGFLAGAWAAGLVGAEGLWPRLGATVLGGAVAIVAGAAVAALLDRDDAHALAAMATRRRADR